jgi:hypothetical protein
LTAGDKTVTAIYAADSHYEYNSTAKEFTVYKRSSHVNASADNITVGETARINITGPAGYDGYAIVWVNGTNYTVKLTNGFGYVNITKLANGTYVINVTYMENDRFSSSYNDTANFTVSKLSSELNVGFENITVGENVVFEVTVPDYGNVTITIGNDTTVVAVKQGMNVIYVPNVAVGEYDVVVAYSGNYKYLENATSAMRLKVAKKELAADDFKVNDTGNGTIIIPLLQTQPET